MKQALISIATIIGLLNMQAVQIAQARSFTYAEAQEAYNAVLNGLQNGTVKRSDLGNSSGPTDPLPAIFKKIRAEFDLCDSPCGTNNDSCHTQCNDVYSAKNREVYTGRNNAISDWEASKTAPTSPIPAPTSSPTTSLTPAPTTPALSPNGRFKYAQSQEEYDSVTQCLKEKGFEAGVGDTPGRSSVCFQHTYTVSDELTRQQSQCSRAFSSNADVEACRDKFHEAIMEVLRSIDAAQIDYAATLNAVTAPPATPIAEPPPPAPTSNVAAPREISYESLKPGEIVTAGPNERVRINFKDGSRVELDNGAQFQNKNSNEYKTLKGKFHFFIEKLKKGGPKNIKVTGTGIAGAVRGTDFLITDEKGITTLQVLEGSVMASAVKGNKSVLVKEGFQVTGTKNGLGKLQRINTPQLDTWFGMLSPVETFWAEAWKKTTAASAYQKECTTIGGQAVAIQELTPDEQKTIDNINNAVTKFKIKEINAIDAVTKKIYISREKSDINGKKTAKIYADAKKLYYQAADGKTWKAYSDATTISEIYSNASEQNLTAPLDKNTFAFTGWSKGYLARGARFDGKLNEAGTDSFIRNMLGASPEEGQELASGAIQIDESSKLWTGISTTVNVKSGKMTAPITRHCTVSYGNGAKITLPSKFKTVDKAIGEKELEQAYISAQSVR